MAKMSRKDAKNALKFFAEDAESREQELGEFEDDGERKENDDDWDEEAPLME